MTDRKIKSDGNIDIEPSGTNSTNIDSDLNVTGTISGNLIGDVTGDLTGDIKAGDGTLVINNGTDGTDLNIPVDLNVSGSVDIGTNLDVTGTINNYNFPSTDGTSGQVLSTDSNGNLSWQTVTSSSSGTGNNVHTFTSQVQLAGYTPADGAILILDNFAFDFSSSGLNVDLEKHTVYAKLPSSGTCKFGNVKDCNIYLDSTNGSNTCTIEIGNCVGVNLTSSSGTSASSLGTTVKQIIPDYATGYLTNCVFNIPHFNYDVILGQISNYRPYYNKINCAYFYYAMSATATSSSLNTFIKTELTCQIFVQKNGTISFNKSKVIAEDIFCDGWFAVDENAYIEANAIDQFTSSLGTRWGSTTHQFNINGDTYSLTNDDLFVQGSARTIKIRNKDKIEIGGYQVVNPWNLNQTFLDSEDLLFIDTGAGGTKTITTDFYNCNIKFVRTPTYGNVDTVYEFNGKLIDTKIINSKGYLKVKLQSGDAVTGNSIECYDLELDVNAFHATIYNTNFEVNKLQFDYGSTLNSITLDKCKGYFGTFPVAPQQSQGFKFLDCEINIGKIIGTTNTSNYGYKTTTSNINIFIVENNQPLKFFKSDGTTVLIDPTDITVGGHKSIKISHDYVSYSYFGTSMSTVTTTAAPMIVLSRPYSNSGISGYPSLGDGRYPYCINPHQTTEFINYTGYKIFGPTGYFGVKSINNNAGQSVYCGIIINVEGWYNVKFTAGCSSYTYSTSTITGSTTWFCNLMKWNQVTGGSFTYANCKFLDHFKNRSSYEGSDTMTGWNPSTWFGYGANATLYWGSRPRQAHFEATLNFQQNDVLFVEISGSGHGGLAGYPNFSATKVD